jgi:uroporphyrinogen decarboxylase
MLQKTTLAHMARDAYRSGRRLVVPLMGFPGVNVTGATIKLAQQNFGIHYQTIAALAHRFQPDLIFPLMDLAVEANAIGRQTEFPKHEAATVVRDAYDPADLARWSRINIAFDTRVIGYVETLKMMSTGLPPTMLRGAYVTGPYSLAGLILGADQAATATLEDPDMVEDLCRFSTEIIQQYMRLLMSAGAQVICILEPSAVMLGPDQFQQFSAGFIRHIAESFRYTAVNLIYHTCGNTMHLARLMADAGVHGISLDSADVGVDLPKVMGLVPDSVAVIGNLNPTGAIFRGTPREVRDETESLLRAMDPWPNFILSTGCDLPQETPLDNIAAFMATGRSHVIL